MLYISDNLKFLRGKRNLSQQEAADNMKLGLDQYKKYEYGKNTPPAEALLTISRFYHISIDLLLTINLQKVKLDELLKLDDNRIVLPIKVDGKGNNLIEIVPHKARMGYATGYADPEFIESLQTISLPFLKQGKFRAFPGSGDSMPPHKDSSFIVGKYLEKVSDVKDGRTYVLVTKNEGIVFKRLRHRSSKAFLAASNNEFYAPYEILFTDILEIWEFVCSIETEEFEVEKLNKESILGLFRELKRDIKKLNKSEQ